VHDGGHRFKPVEYGRNLVEEPKHRPGLARRHDNQIASTTT
jgi:hypothetical protein